MKIIPVSVLSVSLIIILIISLDTVNSSEIETNSLEHLPGDTIEFEVAQVDEAVTFQVNQEGFIHIIQVVEPINGSVSFSFKIPSDWMGQYTIWVSNEEIYDTHTISIVDEIENPDDQRINVPIVYPVICTGFALLLVGGLALSSTEAGRYQILMAFAPLFARLKKDEILDQERRWKILGAVYAQPGIRYSDLKRVLNLDNGTLIHHTRVLVKNDMIVTRLDGSNRRFFSKSMKKRSVALIPGPNLKKIQIEILAGIEAYPGYSQKQLSSMIEMNQSKLSYQLRKLEEMNYIEVLNGKRKRYFLKGGPISYSCSNCHNQFSSEMSPKYCPNCGYSLDYQAQGEKLDKVREGTL